MAFILIIRLPPEKPCAGCLEITDFKPPIELSYLTICKYQKGGCLEISDFNPIWAQLFANLKRPGGGGGGKMAPSSNLANSSQMMIKLGKNILWIEIFPNYKNFLDVIVMLILGKCHFLPGGGAPENWGGSGTLSKIQRGDKKIFQIKKGGSLIFFEEIKYFVKGSVIFYQEGGGLLKIGGSGTLS